MKKAFPFILTLTLSLIFTINIEAQTKRKRTISDSERFSAGLVLGMNNAQIDGDYFTGFDKRGITGGLRGITRLTPRLDFNIEMLYSKKGSKIFQKRALTSARQKKDRIIDLTYIDVPIFFKYLLSNKENIWHIEIGGIYGRLIRSKITENITDSNREFSYLTVEKDFNKDDISGMFGFGYTYKNGIALNLRYVIGVSKFYNNSEYFLPEFGSLINEPVQFLRNYHYTINISYTLFK